MELGPVQDAFHTAAGCMTALVHLMVLGMPGTPPILEPYGPLPLMKAFAPGACRTRMPLLLRRRLRNRKHRRSAQLAKSNLSTRLQDTAACVPTQVGSASEILQYAPQV